MTSERHAACPACGAPVRAGSAFCGDCDSLVTTPDGRLAQRAPLPPATIPVARPAPPLPHDSSQPVRTLAAGAPATVDCWSCDTPNIPSRLFCVSCGSFIAIGSGAAGSASGRRAWRAAASHPELRASSEFRPGAPLAEAPAPFVEGAMTLGPYSEAARRRATRRARTLTAVTSVALTLVVGLAALYVAMPAGDRSRDPRTAALPSASPATDTTTLGETAATTVDEAPADQPDAGDQTGAGDETGAGDQTGTGDPAAGQPSPEPEARPVSGMEIGALRTDAVVDSTADGAAAPDVEAEATTLAEPTTVAEPTKLAEPTTVAEPATDADPATDDPATDVEPATDADPATDVEPATGADPATDLEAEPGSDTTVTREPNEPDEASTPVRGWVCEGPVRIDDSRVRDWSLGRVTFLARPGFERLILHLERSGPGSGETPSVTAATVPTARLNSLMPGIRRPALGRTTIGLRLADGIGGSLALRGYRPSGLAVVKEFSVYPAGVGGRNVLISTASDGCFRLRVPAWDDPSGSVRRAEILIDVQA